MLPHSHEFSIFFVSHSLNTPLTPPPPLKFLFSAFLFLCLSPFSVLFSCYTCSLSPPGSLNTLRLSSDRTKLLKKSESQGEFHQPQNNIRRQKEISSQPATSNHLTVRLCLMYVEVIFFFHSDESRQELPKAPPLTCYFHLLLTYFSKLH